MAAARLGDVDGVSFEVVKWDTVLTALGHEVVFVAGALPPDEVRGTVIREMHFAHHASAAVSEAAFRPGTDPSVIRDGVERLAGPLAEALAGWMHGAAVDRLIVQNAWAIPMHLPLGVALRRAVEATGIPSIGHHHDYWWERERFAECVVPDLLDYAFPPDMPNVTHVSINSPAAAELKDRRGLESVVIPNVFDFAQPMPVDSEARARRLRTDLGLSDDALLVIQPTRVVPRKGIELAIELVARLGRPDAVLLITSPAGDEGFEYLSQLEGLAARMGVDMRYGAQRFRPDREGAAGMRAENPRPEPTHTLVDAYLAADLVTYPSYYEGFGNALVEAMYFGRPIVVNRYPVFVADIAPLGFRFVELDGAVTDEAVAHVQALLADPARRTDDAHHNFLLAERHLSYDRLARTLVELL